MSVAKIVRSIITGSDTSFTRTSLQVGTVKAACYSNSDNSAVVIAFGNNTPCTIKVLGHTVEVSATPKVVLLSSEGVTDWGTDPVGQQVRKALR